MKISHTLHLMGKHFILPHQGIMEWVDWIYLKRLGIRKQILLQNLKIWVIRLILRMIIKQYPFPSRGRYAYMHDARDGGFGDLDIYKVTFLDFPAPYATYIGHVFNKDSVDMEEAHLKENIGCQNKS